MYLKMALMAPPKAFMCSIEHMTFMHSLTSVARYSPSALEVSSGGKPPAASGSSTRDQSKDDRSSFRIVPEMVEHRTNQGTVGIGDEAGDLQAHDPLTRPIEKLRLRHPPRLHLCCISHPWRELNQRPIYRPGRSFSTKQTQSVPATFPQEHAKERSRGAVIIRRLRSCLPLSALAWNWRR